MVEFAVCLPLLLLIVTGLLTFGVAINNYIMLTDATDVGGRLIAIERLQTTNPCADVSTAVLSAAPNLVPGSFSFSLTLNGNVYTGTGSSFSCISSSAITGPAGNLVQGTTARLVVNYPCTLSVYGVNYTPSNCSLQAQTAELVQ